MKDKNKMNNDPPLGFCDFFFPGQENIQNKWCHHNMGAV